MEENYNDDFDDFDYLKENSIVDDDNDSIIVVNIKNKDEEKEEEKNEAEESDCVDSKYLLREKIVVYLKFQKNIYNIIFDFINGY